MVSKTVDLKGKVKLDNIGGGKKDAGFSIGKGKDMLISYPHVSSLDYLTRDSMNLVSSEASNGYVPGCFFFTANDDSAVFHAQNGVLKSFGENVNRKSEDESKTPNRQFIGFEVVPKTEVSHFPDGHKIVQTEERVQVEITQFPDGEKSTPKIEFIDGHRVEHPIKREFFKE